MNQGGKISQFEDILARGGEIGKLLSAIDWNVTSLGSISTWPQSLRTALNISLTSPLPMIVFWGENLIQLYNDAYCLLWRILDPKLSLGQPASELEGELWNCINPCLQTVFTTGETAKILNQPLQIERDGDVKTCYFSFTSSPIWTETGSIGGIFTTVTETTLERVNTPSQENDTQRKNLLQQLETERARLEAVLQQMPAGVLLADGKSGQLILANKQVSQIIGYSYETESKLEEYDQTVDFEGFRANGQRYAPDEWPLMRSLSTGEIVTAEEIRLERTDGNQVFISVNSAPIRDQQGDIVAAVAIFQNITQGKRVEQDLKESQILFEGFMRHIPAIAYIKDEQGRYIYANWVATQLVDSSLENIIGKTDFELFPEIASQFQQHDQAVLSSAQAAEFLECITRNGVEFYGMSFKFPITDAAGRRLLGGMSFDITERKRLEDALRVSEAKFKRLVDANIIGVIVCNLDKIVEANDVFLQMVGYTREQLIAGEISWLNLTPPEYLDVDEQGLEELRNTGKCPPFEKEYIHSSGSRVPILIGATLLEENPLTWLCFVLDLTELKQTEIEREELLKRERTVREEAEAANRIKDEFLAVLSHELRSPLNPILGWASLLRTGKINEETTHRALEIIERNAKLQAQLIEDLLDVSRILRGKLALSTFPVHLDNAIHAALETVQLAADAKEIGLYTHLEPNVRPVLGDLGRLQQIIWNLVSNAVKFTDPGGRVDIYLETVNNQGQVRVQDTGQGITPDFLPHVFDYFRQADSTTTRQFGGLGLGLAIVRYLTELHGGMVWAESPGDGQGATFTVRLPLMMEGEETDFDGELILDVIDLTGIKILAIDDEADMRELVAFFLEEAGASVQLAASAQEALLLLNESLPDVMICDIGMPDVNGYMLMSEIRSKPLEKGGKIPAIALTAYAGETNQKKALTAGFQMHLSKPVEPDKLVAAIAKLLKQTKLKSRESKGIVPQNNIDGI